MTFRPQDLPTKASLPRLRVQYGKGERLAYLGHLEVLATIERCIRRADLPFSIGNGFARRIRVQYSQALPVGASSAAEYFDLRLTERLDAGDALARLAAATPAALAPQAAAYVDEPQAALEAWLTRAVWAVDVLDAGVGAEALLAGVEEVRAAGVLTYFRGEKPKQIDVSRALVSAEATDEALTAAAGAAAGSCHLVLDTRSSNGGALRPQVLLDAAARAAGIGDSVALRVRRLGQWHEAEDGSLVKPL